MAPRRWLWPCSDSQVLRQPAYQNPSLHACLVHPESPDDILVSASDDDLDEHERSAKRRRIETIAHSFLHGKPIFIPSAHLKGPFPADRDLSLCHEPFSSPAGDAAQSRPAVTADTFIRRKPKRPRRQSRSPEPFPTPSKPPQSSPAPLEKPVSRPLSSRHTSRSAKQKALRFDLPSSGKLYPKSFPTPLSKLGQNHIGHALSQGTPVHPTSTNTSQRLPSSAHPVPDSSFFSPSPSPSKDADSPSPSKISSVLRQRPASHLNKVEKERPASKRSDLQRKQQLSKKLYQETAALHGASPLMFRKNAPQPKRASNKTESKGAGDQEISEKLNPLSEGTNIPVSPERRRLVLFESSLDAPTSNSTHPSPATANLIQPSKDIQHDFAPAINMSFGQESLGMDFDIINHFNTAEPEPPAEKESPVFGRLITGHGDQATSATTELPTLNIESKRVHVESPLSAEAVADQLDRDLHYSGDDMVPGLAGPAGDVEGTQSGQENTKPMAKSKQHLDKEEEMNEDGGQPDETAYVPAAEVPLEVTHDPAEEPVDDTVIDHLEADDDPLDELPYISTQAAMQDAHRALFDASSPLGPPQADGTELPLETPIKQITSPPSSPVHTITPFHQFNADMVTDTQAPLPNTQALFEGFYSPIKLSIKKPKTANRASFAPSVIPEDVDTTVESILELVDDDVVDQESRSQLELELSQAITTDDRINPEPESLRGRSGSPDIFFSQQSLSGVKDLTDPALPGFKKQLIPLAEILRFASQKRGIDVRTLLSQGTPAASQRVPIKGARKSTRSSQPKAASERKVGQRKSLRLSMSQPNPQAEDDYESGSGLEGMTTISQPDPVFRDLGQPSVSETTTVPDVSSTIPDPSLIFNHLHQNATPASGTPAMTPHSAPQSSGFSSFQPAQRPRSSLIDLDSTIEDLQQSFLQPWDRETASSNLTRD